MPQLASPLQSATLARWLAAEGDIVAAGDVVAEISAGRMTLEIETEAGGVIDRILMPAGTAEVAPGKPIALLRATSSTDAAAPARGNADPLRPSSAMAPAGGVSMREALRETLRAAMRADPDIFVMAQGLDGGTAGFGVLQGLKEEFGSRRARDVPLVEQGFCGMAVGAALAGLRPVVELSHLGLTMQALDHIALIAPGISDVSAGRAACPVLFRGPHGTVAGGASLAYQDVGAMLARVPGLTVLQPYAAADAAGLLALALRLDGPAVLLEDEALYATRTEVPDPDPWQPEIGKARIWREGSDVTLVAVGAAVGDALEAVRMLEGDGISVEVIDLRSLAPLDETCLTTSIRKTGRCVTAERGWPVGGIGQRIAALAMDTAFDRLSAPVRTCSARPVPPTYAETLEEEARITPAGIADAIRSVCGG